MISAMRYILVLFFVCLCTFSFSQTNPDKDAKKLADKERIFYMTHKVKEVDEHFATSESHIPNDSTLFCRLFYNKKGNLIKTIEYQPFAAAQKIAHRTTTTLYDYNGKDQLIGVTSTADQYLLIHGAVKKTNNSDLFDKDETYKYNKYGNVETKNYVLPTGEENTIGKSNNAPFDSKWIMVKRNYTDVYSYDEVNNLLSLTKYNYEGKLVTTTGCFYDSKARLIKNTIYNEDKKK